MKSRVAKPPLQHQCCTESLSLSPYHGHQGHFLFQSTIFVSFEDDWEVFQARADWREQEAEGKKSIEKAILY